jgi:hypothetical protein
VNWSDISALAFPVLNHRIGFRYITDDTDRILATRQLISRAVERVTEDGARGS